MRNGNDNNSCLFGEQLVSYIYDELPASGRSSFEDHLLSCSGCTDEFASISMSRLGVYEWHRDDFLPLETPVFSIPYQRPIDVADTQVSWLDALRGLFSPARLLTAGGAFAILAVAFGAVYFATLNSGEGVAIANADRGIGETENRTSAELPSPSAGTKDRGIAPDTASVQERPKTSSRENKPIQVKATKRVVNRNSTVQASIPQKAPRLGTYDEAEDTSLRLADLVADIDTRDF